MINFNTVSKDIELNPKNNFCILTKELFYHMIFPKVWFKSYDKYDPNITKIKITLDKKGEEEKRLKLHLEEGDLFSSGKLIVIKNFQNLSKDGTELVEKVLQDTSKKKLIMIFTEKKCPFKEKKLISTIDMLKKPKTYEIAQIIKWIVQQEGGYIDEDAVNLLIDFIGSDLMQLYNEILKILNYNRKMYINREAVTNLAVRIKEENIFLLTDSLANGDKKTSAKTVNNLIEQGSYPLQILAVVSTHFSRILHIKLGILEKKSRKEIQLETGFKDFYFNKLYSQAQYLSTERINYILEQLTQLEIKIKENKIPSRINWDGFIFNL